MAGDGGENLVRNPGFEAGGNLWVVEKRGENAVHWLDDQAHSGRRCAKLVFGGKDFVWLDTNVEQGRKWNLPPGSVVGVSLYVKRLAGGGDLILGFNIRGTDGGWVASRDDRARCAIPTEREWHRLTAYMLVPKYDTRNQCLQLKIGAHQSLKVPAFTVLVDDVSLTLVARPQDLHPPRFEEFLRRHPDASVRSWTDLRFGLIDRDANGCKMRDVLVDFGVSLRRIRDIGPDLSGLEQCHVLVVADGAVDLRRAPWQDGSKIRDFVRRGGVCWITSQDPSKWTSEWLPPRLSAVTLKRQYGLRCVAFKAPHYVCPWLIGRQHQVFNFPNYVNESDFSFWTLTVDGTPCFTAGFSALTTARGWGVLGRYADPYCDDGALILEAPYGEGLFFWTQIFSPQILWRTGGRPRRAWNKFMENILCYFAGFLSGEIFRINAEPRPWSVRAGERVDFDVKVQSALRPTKAIAQVNLPDGRVEEAGLAPGKEDNSVFHGSFIPRLGGEHFVRIVVDFDGGAKRFGHFVFKVTNGWTAYRFVEHIHFRDADGWGTQCAGALFGAARLLGYDALLIAAIRDGGRWQEMRAADNPACRFVPGEEIHFRVYKRTGEKAKHFADDIRAINIGKFMPFGKIYDDEAQDVVARYIAETHRQGGFVTANTTFWLRRGLMTDATYDVFGMYEFWRKGKRVWAIRPVDCHGIVTLITRRNFNIVWLNKPLSIPNLMEALKAGRFVPSTRIDVVWMDVCGQPVGGTVFAVDEVQIRFRIDAGEPPRDIGVIRWPAPPPKPHPIEGHFELEDRLYYRPSDRAYVIEPEKPRRIESIEIVKNGKAIWSAKPQTKIATHSLVDKVEDNAFYCLVVRSNTGFAHTNPVFVKRIQGPSGAWLWSEGEVAGVRYDGQARVWRVALAKPGKIRFRLPRKPFVEIDGGPARDDYDPSTHVGQIAVPERARVVEIHLSGASPAERGAVAH